MAENPVVRHEFVGMMFAVTIGEVGLQAASLVQAKHYAHFLPFYLHLLLATLVITSSWVGWSLSRATGARRDVTGVFSWGFFTLLLDVGLVIWYFIMVRTIEVGKGRESSRIETPQKLAGLMVGMFGLYLLWDVVTKWCAYSRSNDGPWFRNSGLRMVPTLICLTVATCVWRSLNNVDLTHYINADIGLIGLALLFRALKDIISAGYPKLVKATGDDHLYVPERAPDIDGEIRAAICAAFCLFILIGGTISARITWTPLPSNVVQQINASPTQENAK